MNSFLTIKDELGRVRQLSVREVKHEASTRLLQGNPQAALALLSGAAPLAAGDAEVLFLLGEAQNRTGAFEAAIENLQKALALRDGNPAFENALATAYCELGSKYLDNGQTEEALHISEQGLKSFPEHPGILGNLSVALYRFGRYEEAIGFAQKQLECKGDPAQVLANLCVFTCAAGRLEEAERFGRQAIAQDGESAMAHYNLALVLLLAGKYREGFEEYEWRWRSKRGKARCRHFEKPLWDGSPRGTQRLLIYAEQGAGDLIQFVRYTSLLKGAAEKIIFEVPQSTYRLMKTIAEDIDFVTSEPASDEFDVQCPVLRLPLLSKTDENSIPAPQTFGIPEEVQKKWAGILPPSRELKIGIVWAGSPTHQNDRNRSLRLSALHPLLDLPVQIFSFQVGAASGQIEEHGLTQRIQDLSPHLSDYLETAAALQQLDLVITADTSVAHLAGSLGLATWVMLPFAPDWRWLLGRGDSPWYPTMRLFRQSKSGDWADVIENVCAAVAELPKSS